MKTYEVCVIGDIREGSKSIDTRIIEAENEVEAFLKHPTISPAALYFENCDTIDKCRTTLEMLDDFLEFFVKEKKDA